MVKSSGKVYINSHLRVLYKLCYKLGLIHFKFDHSKQRFRQSKRRLLITSVVYKFFEFFYGYIAILCLAKVFLSYMNIMTLYDNSMKAIEIQETFFGLVGVFLRYLETGTFALNYLRLRRSLLPNINEVLSIFQEIKRRSNSNLFFKLSLNKFIVFKLCLLICRVEYNFIPMVVTMFIGLDVFAPYSLVMCGLTTMTYFYMQLVLICFYLKMVEFLKAHAPKMKKERLIRNIKQLLAISFRIYQVKRKLDKFYVSVFVVTCLGLMADIRESYAVFKIVVYAKYDHDNNTVVDMLRALRFHVPVCVSYSFDMFLICRLSEELIEAEAEFQRCVMEIFLREDILKSGCLRREVELMLQQNHLFSLSTYVFDHFHLNRQFSFECVMNIITAYAISCLQFYASQSIYVVGSVEDVDNSTSKT